MPARMVLLRHGATEWALNGQHTGRTDIPLLDQGREQAERAGQILRDHGFTRFALVLRARSCVPRRPVRWPGSGGRGRARSDGMGLRRLRGPDGGRDPRATARLDAVGRRGPRGRADIGRRAPGGPRDRAGPERDGDTLCVAHGHLLRVLAARWVGLPPVAGRLLLLRPGGICVLGWELDFPAIEVWNRSVAP